MLECPILSRIEGQDQPPFSEAEVHWREFFAPLKARGLGLPRMITSGAHEGEIARFDGAFYWYGSSYANNPKGKFGIALPLSSTTPRFGHRQGEDGIP